MSETDSDLDFESADEETDQDSSERSNVVSQHCKVSEEEKCTSSRLAADDIDSATPSCEANILNQHVNQNETVKEKPSIIKSDNADESNSQHEKQRVTLRLEKKLQQKSQLSKENSVEKQEAAISNSSANIRNSEGKSSSWGFGSWSTSLLSTAASSVSTFTNQVSQGIGTVLETVENTLGAPSPEELAGTLDKKKETTDTFSVDKKALPGDDNENPSETAFEELKDTESKTRLLPDVSAWTKVLENTSSKVIMGGLDTLELIGKKTIDILTEGDPGLRKKRAVFSDGITLSQILREAKAEADEKGENSNTEGVDSIHYSQLFDEYQGLVHLEALEMLSKQSEAKLQRLLMRHARNAEIKRNLEEIKCICENIPSLDDPSECEQFQDFEPVFKKHILKLNLPFSSDNIIKTQRRINEIVSKYENISESNNTPEEIYQAAICNLAEFTAKCIETFHKLTELILVQTVLKPNAEQCATNLTGLTTVMCIEINNLSSRYHKYLDSFIENSKDSASQSSNITVIVTNLYVEAANSNKYIQDAYQLLIPVLQVSLMESAE